ncbi:MAG: hypothetical protein WC441_04830 [Patescibacteria group bacterium]
MEITDEFINAVAVRLEERAIYKVNGVKGIDTESVRGSLVGPMPEMASDENKLKELKELKENILDEVSKSIEDALSGIKNIMMTDGDVYNILNESVMNYSYRAGNIEIDEDKGLAFDENGKLYVNLTASKGLAFDENGAIYSTLDEC